MSNVIKAYTVRYKEEMKVVDVTEREDVIHSKIAEAVLESSFVGGIRAIALEEDGEYLPGEIGEDGNPAEGSTEENEGIRSVMTPAMIEAWKEEERQKLKVELTEAEKVALRIEMEKELRTQADIILEQARAQGEQLKTKAKLAAEAEKLELFEAAKREGYEEGKQQLLREKEALESSFAEKERLLAEEFEAKVNALEPQAVDSLIRLLQYLTGVCLESKRGIVTYLVSKTLTEAERSNSFLIKVSKDDFDEVRGNVSSLRALFEREVTLEVVQDALLKQGECMIETDSNIIDCSLGTQLEGLIEDIRLLSVQERV